MRVFGTETQQADGEDAREELHEEAVLQSGINRLRLTDLRSQGNRRLLENL